MSSVASEGSPCASLSVKARGIAGSPGRAGGGVCGAITSALCGKTPSWLRKSISVCQPTGTTSVSCPSRNPLKFRAPFTPVSPAINWKRTVLAAVSTLSQVGATVCCWAVAGAAGDGERRFATDSAYTADPSGGKGSFGGLNPKPREIWVDWGFPENSGLYQATVAVVTEPASPGVLALRPT